jgi:hypothetical protein
MHRFRSIAGLPPLHQSYDHVADEAKSNGVMVLAAVAVGINKLKHV